MKNLKWLIEVADKKPLLFSLLILLIAVGSLAQMVKDRTNKLDDCVNAQGKIQEYYNHKIDSLTNYYTNREAQLNLEVKQTLTSIITEYKVRLEEQKKFNDQITYTIKENKRIINKTKRR